MMTEADTRGATAAMLARWLDAMKKRDVEAVVALVSDDCAVESMTSGGLSGRAGIRQLYGEWLAAFPDFAVHAEETIVDGDRGVLVLTLAGTDLGGFMSLPATGKSFRLSVVVVLTIAGGRVVRYRSVYDFTGLLVQVGILKAKPAL
jgi:steroid delta-isomerase-like uncharacterized protein